MTRITGRLWGWPDGVAWRATARLTSNSRRQRYELLLSNLKPEASWKVLDVGVSAHRGRNTNYLEEWYRWPEQITALANEDLGTYQEFKAAFPRVHLVRGDGRRLDYPEYFFDLVHSNAVVEHVGSRGRQAEFVAECSRVGRRVFVATPNRWFPVDPHTLVPFVHWLPSRLRFPLLRLFGRGYWASEDRLNPLDRRALAGLIPAGTPYRILRQRVLGMTSVLVLVIDRTASLADGA